MKIERSSGITGSERYLKRLCDNTFLSLWSYPNLYRDQGSGQSGTGKELCDLLVVFEHHIIIFSDKRYDFPNTGDTLLDWKRWFKRAIAKSAKQIYGAERWIKNFPQRIFLDPKCTRRFPLNLPSAQRARFHRIVIAHGAQDRCVKYFNGGSGSLMINSWLVGSKHLQTPFTIGQINPHKGYVHVWDDTTMDIVLQTLDTVADLVAYLERKENLLTNPDILVIAAGEEDLLGYYLQQVSPDGEHYFKLPQGTNALVVGEGIWEEFEQSPQRQAQIAANKISYRWDALIETFNRYILEDAQFYAYPKGVENQEMGVRMLARENRLRRRMLSKALIDLLDKTPVTQRATRVVPPSRSGEPCYVFLLLPKPLDLPDEEYRERRRNLLHAYCLVAKLLYPDAIGVVGIATEPGKGLYRSEDLLYFDAAWWDEENRELAEYLHKEIGLLRHLQGVHHNEQEYPVSQ